jgi:hypothetical protein
MPIKSAIERVHHSVPEGYCRMEILQDAVRVRCEWPLDLETEE